MAKEFVMGARVNMSDGFSSPVSSMSRSTQQFSNSVRQADRDVDHFEHNTQNAARGAMAFSMGSRAATMSVRGLAGGVATLATSLLGLGGIMSTILGLLTFKFAYDWLVKSNAQMENYQTILTGVLGDQQKAMETIAWATKLAEDTPFELPDIIEATVRLQAYGLEATKVLGITADMAGRMGKPLKQAFEAVADAQTGELERLKEFGITKNAIAENAKLLGVSVMDNKGSITDQLGFNAVLFDLMEKKFKGGAAELAKTYDGMMSNAKDFIGTMGREFGKPIFDRMKAGLTGLMDGINDFKADGGMQSMILDAQIFGGQVADRLGAAAAFVGNILGTIANKVRSFVDANMGTIAHIGAMLYNVFLFLYNAAAPVINWLVYAALPVVLDILSLVAGWVLKVAELFLNNWTDIAPFLLGIATALGLILGPAYTLIGIAYVAAQAMRVWAAAQALLNIVMSVNPVYLMILAIGLLIGAAYWVVANWEKVKTFFAGVWPYMVGAALGPLGMLVSYVVTHFSEIRDFVTNLATEAYTWGANIIKTMIDGIVSMKDALVNAVTGVFSKVRELMPFSDAKAGPFSQLTYSGGAIMETMAQGVTDNATTLQNAVQGAFSQAMPDQYENAYGNQTPTTVAATSAVSPVGRVNAPGSQRTVTIGNLVGQLLIEGVDADKAKEIAETVIEMLHDKLAEASDIMASDEMEALL